jgi:L-threonylcarbamoyladenylate synthase
MRASIEDAAAAVLRGELVVFPTDTVIGIGARPDDPDATERLFVAKMRPKHLELPVLVASAGDARAIAEIEGQASSLIEAFWPGGLTLVLRRSERSSGWNLGGDQETIGVRQPAHPIALELLVRTGPIAATSANISGEDPPDPGGIPGVFGEAVSVYLFDDRPLGGTPSTVLDLAHGRPQVLREGAVGVPALARVLSAPIG